MKIRIVAINIIPYFSGYDELVRNGLSEAMLLSRKPLPEIVSITNSTILDLIKFKNDHGIAFNVFYCWLEEIYGEKWPYPDPPTCPAIIKCVDRLFAKSVKIKKQRSSQSKEKLISEFLQEEFILPTVGLRRGQVITFSPPRKIKKQSDVTSNSDVQMIYTKMYKEMKQKMYAINRNANKRLKRKDAVIQKQADRIESQTKAIKEYKKNLLDQKLT